MLVREGAVVDPDLGYRFSEGGMFEIYLAEPPAPVTARGCETVVVRMPWTDSAYADAPARIAGKRALFDALEGLLAGSVPSVPVVLELDPYLDRTGGGYNLTQCLAFFRHAFGAYVPDTGPVAPR
ncbi:MAG: hypothetical protein AAF074_23630 [Pseudomonadota bacterium]